jgi:hypothetical protein
MHETELLRRISELEAQNRVLIAENKRLRKALGVTSENPASETITEQAVETIPETTDCVIDEAPTNLPHINKYSSPEEKIELFMSLFRGREDVYAKWCYSKKYVHREFLPLPK